MRRLLVLLAAASLAVLQAQPRDGGGPPARRSAPVAQTEPVKAEDLGAVEGTVVDAVTGQPLDKAHVMLIRQQSQTGRPIGATTNSAGQFVVDKVEPGTYRISAQRNRYARSAFPGGEDQLPPPVSVAPKQRLKDVVLRLTPAGIITGRVTDEDGEPLAYANVALMQYRYARGKRQLAPVSGGPSTNDLGEYRLFGLNPGRYYVRVSVPDRGEMFGAAAGPSPNSAEMSYASLFYPGVSDPTQAQLVTVKAGELIPGIDFRMTRTRTIRISGRVINATGAPAREVMINISPAGASGFDFMTRRMNSTDRQTGRFELAGIPPGSYILSAFSRPGGGDSLFARAEIQAGSANIEGLELTLAPGAVINGVVRITGDSPSPVPMEDIRVFLQGRDDNNMMFASTSGAVKADGSFELRNVAPHNYRVTMFRIPEDGYLKAARLGEIDVLEKGLQVDPGSGGALELTIHLQGGRVEGAVLDEKKSPAPGATVVLVPAQRDREDLFKSVGADQYGRFSFRGLRPGEYKVFAWTKVEGGSWLDPAFLEPVEDRGKKVTVKENDAQGVELDAIPNPENPAN